MNANNAPLIANTRRVTVDIDPDEFADIVRDCPGFNPTNVVIDAGPAHAANVVFDATPAHLAAYIAFAGLDASDRDDIFLDA